MAYVNYSAPVKLYVDGERNKTGLFNSLNKLIDMARKNKSVNALAFAKALADERAKREAADLKVPVAKVYKKPSRTSVAELQGIIDMHSLPFVTEFMGHCEALCVSLATLKRLAAWVRNEANGFVKSGKCPRDVLIRDQAAIIRGAKNAGRRGKRAGKRKGGGRKPDPVARLSAISEAAAEFKSMFGDKGGLMERIIVNCASLMKYARDVKAAQKK